MTCCGCVCTCSAPHIQPPCTWNTITLHQCKPKLTMIYHPDGCVYILPFSVLLSDCMYCILPSLLCTVAERRERSELSEANNCSLFEILYICVCLHVHYTRPCTPYTSPVTSAHCALSFGAPFWRVAHSLDKADGASSAEDSPGSNSNLSHTSTATRHRECPDDDSDLCRMRTATGRRKHSSSQAVAQREERLAAEGLQHIPFFITSTL